jgi:Na+/H+ antiporter NhaD/arsenite permease-like protein
LIFAAVFLAIATERVQRLTAALLGVAAMWGLGLISGVEALHFIDFKVLLLLFGMMVLVAGLREAHFFRWVGIQLANLVSCNPAKMLVLFTLITGLLSAFLDNVTTMLFMVTITLEIVEILHLPPMPFVISEVFASNIGGTATLVGGVPNMMIASSFHLSFMDFILNLSAIATLCLIVATAVWYWQVKRKLASPREFTTIPVETAEIIADPAFFYITLTIFMATVSFFFLHDYLGVEPHLVAMMAAIVLLVLVGQRIPRIFHAIEWETLFFIAAMLILVGGLEKTGILSQLAGLIVTYTKGSPVLALSAILWTSAIGSAAIDNIPLAATFIPMIASLAAPLHLSVKTMAWALALGTGLGGNGTPVASAASVVAVGVAARRGHPISFKEFTKMGLTMVVLTTGLSNLYLALRYILLT